MADQQTVPIDLEKSIDTSAVERDVQPWDTQSLVLVNTGICREGGVTNLGAKIGLDSDYEETFYCGNGSKAQLKRDIINRCFHVYSDSRELGIVPLWAVKSRGLISSNVADVMATITGTFLLLYFTQGVATIEEVDASTFARIKIRSFAIPTGLSQIAFVRTKQPTFANTLSLAAYSVALSTSTRVITAYILDQFGTVFSDTVTANSGAEPIALLAHYEHGWILEVDIWNNSLTTNNLWMIKSDGSGNKLLGQINTKGLIQDYDIATGNVTYKTFIDHAPSTSLDFVSVGMSGHAWYGIDCDKDGTMWACVRGGDIYKKAIGDTSFFAVGGTSRAWTDIGCDPVTGDKWACVYNGDIYRCPYGSTTFTATGGASQLWNGIAIESNGDKWACTQNVGIFKSPYGSVTFTAIYGSGIAWTGITVDKFDNKWACVTSGGGIYICPPGYSVFTLITGTNISGNGWNGIGCDSVGNVWVCDYNHQTIYRCIAGTSVFLLISTSALYAQGISGDLDGNIWLVTAIGDIYLYSAPYYYGYLITPPASDGLDWDILPQVDDTIGGVISKRNITFGGFAITNSSILAYHNWSSVRSWLIYQKDVPEIYGDLWPALTDFALKIHTIGGLGSYLSASFDPDGIGAPITEIGELNPYYAPQAIQLSASEYLVIYQRGDGVFASISISSEAFERMQEIKSGVVKINCASGLNICDTIASDLKMGGNAFNGFAVVGFASAALMGAWAARHRGTYGGSVDTNYKNNTAIVAGSVTFVVIPESVQFSSNNEMIDIFVGLPPSSLNYFESIISGAGAAQNPSLIGTIYVDDQVIPIPAASDILERSAILIRTSTLREIDYDGYQLGNEIVGSYKSFVLYGNIYFVDSEWIRGIVATAGNVISSANKIVPVKGLRYITASPTESYFISDFDNSLFRFGGGQSVEKQALFNRRESIRDGVFSVVENTLALLADSAVVFIRDGIITETPLPYSTPPRPFATIDGIWLSQSGYSMRFVFNLIGASSSPTPVVDILDGGAWGTAYADTLDGGAWGDSLDVIDGGVWGSGGNSDMIVSLKWQSKFLGFSDRAIQMIDRFLVRLYKEDKAQATIDITFEYSAENTQNIESRSYIIGDINNPWDSEGYAYIEYIPTQKRSIALSLRIESDDKILILSAMAMLTSDGVSAVTNR